MTCCGIWATSSTVTREYLLWAINTLMIGVTVPFTETLGEGQEF